MNISAISSNSMCKIAPKVQNNNVSFRAKHSSVDEFVPTTGISSTSSEWRSLKKEGAKLASKSFEYLQQARAAQLEGEQYMKNFDDIMTGDLGIQKEYYSQYYSEALKIFEEAKNENFKTYHNPDSSVYGYWSKREVKVEGSAIKITEYDDEDFDEVTREITFTPTTITFDDVIAMTGHINRFVIDLKTGNLKSLQADISYHLFGGYTSKREFYFNDDGTIKRYEELHKTDGSGDEKIKGLCIFDENNRPKELYVDYKTNRHDKTTEAKQLFRYEDGVLKSCDENYWFDGFRHHLAKKRFAYSPNGSIDAVLTNFINNYSRVLASTVHTYTNNAIKQIQVGYDEYGYKNIARAKKIFKINPYMEVESCTLNNEGKEYGNYKIQDITSKQKAIFI